MDLPGPTLPPVPRVIPLTCDVHFRWEGPQGQQCENVYQVHYDAGPLSGDTLDALAAAVAARLLPLYKPIVHNTCRFVEVYVADLSVPFGGFEGRYTFPNSTFGLATGEAQASSVAANIMLGTGQRGRKRRGAKRYGGFSEDHTNRDTFSNAILALLQQLVLGLLQDWVVGGMTFQTAVGSFKGGFSTPVTTFSMVDSNIDSQKTRINQRGS